MNTTQGTIILLRPLILAFLSAKRAENISPATVGFYRKKMMAFDDFCYSQGIKEISHLTPDGVRQFLIALQDTGHNDGGLHAHFRVLRTFLIWYEKEFEPDDWHNPIRKVKAPKIAIEPLEPCNIEDVAKMMKVCGSDLNGKRDQAMFLVLLDSGVRASELLAIQLSEIDILTGQVFINKGKGRKSRYIYLGEKSRRAVRQYLRTRTDTSPALWVGREGFPLTYWGLVSILDRRAKQAGVPQPSIHSFRYFFALTSLRNGMDIFSLQKAGGWASMTVMRRYLKQSESDVEVAMKRYSPVDNLK
jgi:integrase/recombinase XerD